MTAGERSVGTRLLFLDFDGVMHPFRCTIDKYFCHLELLEAWLRQRPDVGVVISSSWREAHPVAEMTSFFSEDLQHRILGATPLLKRDSWAQYDGEPPLVRFEREVEVLRWLNESGEPWRPWAALDDQAWLYKPFNPGLVLCDGKVGLTLLELNKLDRVLGFT